MTGPQFRITVPRETHAKKVLKIFVCCISIQSLLHFLLTQILRLRNNPRTHHHLFFTTRICIATKSQPHERTDVWCGGSLAEWNSGFPEYDRQTDTNKPIKACACSGLLYVHFWQQRVASSRASSTRDTNPVVCWWRHSTCLDVGLALKAQLKSNEVVGLSSWGSSRYFSARWLFIDFVGTPGLV